MLTWFDIIHLFNFYYFQYYTININNTINYMTLYSDLAIYLHKELY